MTQAQPAFPDFEAMPFPIRSFCSLTDVTRYRVYTAPRRYVAVKAQTAAEALRLSGVKEPLRVVRDIRENQTLLPPGTADLQEAKSNTQA